MHRLAEQEQAARSQLLEAEWGAWLSPRHRPSRSCSPAPRLSFAWTQNLSALIDVVVGITLGGGGGSIHLVNNYGSCF